MRVLRWFIWQFIPFRNCPVEKRVPCNHGNLWTSSLVCCLWYLNWWLPLVLLSSEWVWYSAPLIPTNPCDILYNMVSLSFFLLCFRVSQSRLLSISVTLLYFLTSALQKRAALLCTISRRCLWVWVRGSHTTLAYSRIGPSRLYLKIINRALLILVEPLISSRTTLRADFPSLSTLRLDKSSGHTIYSFITNFATDSCLISSSRWLPRSCALFESR